MLNESTERLARFNRIDIVGHSQHVLHFDIPPKIIIIFFLFYKIKTLIKYIIYILF